MPTPRTWPTTLTAASNAHTAVTVCGLAAAALAYLVIPGALTRASVGIVAPWLAPWWASAVLVGGLVAFLGLLGRRPRVEVLGLGLVGAGMCLAAAAIVEVHEPTSLPSAIVYATAGIAAVARTLTLVHLQHVREQLAELAEGRDCR